MIPRWVAAVAAAALLVLPAHAGAAPGMEVGIADDAVLLAGGQTAIDAVAEWQRLGVDNARVFAQWSRIAPGDRSGSPPAGFDARDANDPQYDWAALDNAVKLLLDAGIKPMLAITGPGPLWSSSEPARGNPRYLPDPREFGDFASAVAQRYGDRVSRYIVWNEPNQPAWLQPQFTCRGSSCRPAAPHRYRDLYRAAYNAIRAADPGAQVLIGALAPKGSDPVARNRTMRPLQFVRALACVDDKHLKRVRTGACKGQTTVRADGFAYHPHPVRFSPTTKNTQKDNAAIADLPHFEAVLDTATRNGIIKPTHGSRFPLYLTEFGYQTNPPDPDAGVSLATQAKWLQESWYIAWADRRVRDITQYEWRDESVRTAGASEYASWQSGLRFDDGRPKPSLAVFPNPFWVDVRRGAKKARLWGQVRPGGSWPVEVEQLSGGSWRTVKTIQTDGSGYWTLRLRLKGKTTLRFSYERDGDAVHSSRETVKPVR